MAKPPPSSVRETPLRQDELDAFEVLRAFNPNIRAGNSVPSRNAWLVAAKLGFQFSYVMGGLKGLAARGYVELPGGESATEVVLTANGFNSLSLR